MISRVFFKLKVSGTRILKVPEIAPYTENTGDVLNFHIATLNFLKFPFFKFFIQI